MSLKKYDAFDKKTKKVDSNETKVQIKSRYECGVCEKTYAMKQTLEIHRKAIHEEGIIVFALHSVIFAQFMSKRIQEN